MVSHYHKLFAWYFLNECKSKCWISLRRDICRNLKILFIYFLSWMHVLQNKLSFLKWEILCNWCISTKEWTLICYIPFYVAHLSMAIHQSFDRFILFYPEKLHDICMYGLWQQNHFLYYRFIVLNSNISSSS